MRHPAGSEPNRREPPPHLRRALRAAAAARDRAERIREVEPPVAPASQPPIRPGASARANLPPQADPLRGQPSEPVRFARTFAAAQQLRAVIAEEGAELPLHLRLRDEEKARRRPARWLSLLLKPLSARPRPAPDRLSVPAPHPVAAAVPEPPQRPADEEALRLPPLGRGALDGDAPLSALADPASADPEIAGPEPQRAAGPQTGGGEQAAAGARLEPPRGPLYRPWLAQHAAPRASDQLAWATRWRPSWSGAEIPAEQTARNLPVPYAGPGLPATRLADVLAGRRRPSGDPRPNRAGPASGPRCAPSGATVFAALRSRSRWLMLSGALAAGFALGIVAYGSSPLSGTRWGPAMLALDAGWLGGTGSDRAAPATLGDPTSIAELPAAARAAPAAGGRVDSGAERRSATSGFGAAAPRPIAPPETRPAARASAISDRDASGDAIARGPVDFSRSARATVAPPATLQGAMADWQSLYAEGHRFQLAGNLVAAADAYRRAIGANPEHAAIHYDLGYVLQMQGRAAAAIDHYRRAIALQADHGYAHYNLGYLLQSLGENAAALEHYEFAAARLPDNAFVYYDWGWSLELSGDRAGAAALYRKAIALGPEDRPGIDARRRLAALGRSAQLQ